MWNQKRPMFTRDSVFGTFQLRYASRAVTSSPGRRRQRPLQRARHFKVQHCGEVFGYGHVEPQTQTLVCLELTA